MNENGLNYIDLFAGAGGLSEGFIQSGYRPVAHVEMNEHAAKTIETRIAYYYLKDKGKIKSYYDYEKGELTREQLLEKIPQEELKTVINKEMSESTIKGIFNTIDDIKREKEIDKIDVIIGGPPCQAYSLVGRAQSSHMIVPMEDDPRNELYKMYVQFLNKYKPTFEDISPVLLEDHLRKTGSKLAKQVRKRGVEEILNDMQLLVGPPELRYIQNVAIMMFCEHPEKFFGYTYVQMTSFPKGSIENPSISEDFPNITGSVPQMIQATMERFRNLIIREKVIKVPNQMEALRIFNYPYQAIEEAVVNAFYHRDYMSFEPVTIEIEPDCINIMNFPGIDRSISEKTIAEGKRFVSRYYRNRRLGDFLKELDLSEGHSSGIPTIQEELEKNGSPRAEFFTDEDRRAMRIRIPIHPAFLEADD